MSGKQTAEEQLKELAKNREDRITEFNNRYKTRLKYTGRGILTAKDIDLIANLVVERIEEAMKKK